MSEEILIRVRVNHDDPYDYEECTLTQDNVSFNDLLRENENYLSSLGYIKVSDVSKNISKEDVKILSKHGWVHEKTVQDREKRKVVTQEYFLVDQIAKGYYPDFKFCKVDVNNLTDSQLDQLSRSAQLVQVVDEKTVLTSSDLKKLTTKKNNIKEKNEKLKLTLQKKADKKKAKELEAAKKLLEEAGHIRNYKKIRSSKPPI